MTNFAFDRKSAERIGETVRRVEQMPVGRAKEPNKPLERISAPARPPWRFEQRNLTSGWIHPGLILVRWDIWVVDTTPYIYNWVSVNPEGDSSDSSGAEAADHRMLIDNLGNGLGQARSHWWIEFELDGADITANLRQGAAWPSMVTGDNYGPGGYPSTPAYYNVPLLSFETAVEQDSSGNDEDRITTWHQHQWSSIKLPRL